jgi:hypothetical protein
VPSVHPRKRGLVRIEKMQRQWGNIPQPLIPQTFEISCSLYTNKLTRNYFLDYKEVVKIINFHAVKARPAWNLHIKMMRYYIINSS